MIPKLTRRGAVAMAAMGLLAGCSGGARAEQEAPRKAAAPRPGAAEQARAIRDSTALVARYDAVAAAHPALAARLAPLRAETARHVEAFGGPASVATAPAGAPTGAAGPAVPVSAARALADLASAERSLADRRATALLDAPGDLARLLASVAASGAGHVLLLTT